VNPGDGGAALAYHEATKHSERSLRGDRHLLDWANQPLPFKLYRGLEPLPLPRELAEREVSALDALAARTTGPGPERIPDLESLARVLFLSAGIIKRVRHGRGELAFRAYPNTGALYHVDLYLACADLPGLATGVYHFGPHDFALRRLRAGDWRARLVEASGGNAELARAPVIAACASTWWRNAWKYRARAYRHCFWDAGTLLANLLAAAASESLEPSLVLGFADASVEELFGLDPRREAALALVALGRTRAAAPPSAALEPLVLETQPLSRSEVDYPAIRELHAHSSLASGDGVRAWRAAALAPRSDPPAASTPVELAARASAGLPAATLDRVIRRRGSTRAFDPARSIRLEELSTALECAACPVPADFLEPGASALDLYLIVHAVEGLEPGTYFYRRGERALERLRAGSFRAQAGRLGLFQELPAEAAVNVYSLCELTALTARLGSRGYRAAQLEGGIAGGRLYLAAYAQGFGATGLTFLDDEVTRFFAPHAGGKAVMFLTALGHADRARIDPH
jgi:SagB-type dehydrogenase family enzyme